MKYGLRIFIRNNRNAYTNNTLSAEDREQYELYQRQVALDARDAIARFENTINSGGTLSEEEKQQYEMYKEQMSNAELLKDRESLREESNRLQGLYNSLEAQFQEERDAQIGRNETSIRQAALQIQDIAVGDAELQNQLSAPIEVTFSDGQTRNVNGLDLLSRCIDQNGNINRDANGNIVYTDENGAQQNIELRDLQEVIEGMRGSARGLRGNTQVQSTSRQIRRGSRGGNNNGGNNNGGNNAGGGNS